MKVFLSLIAELRGKKKDEIWVQKTNLQRILETQDEFNNINQKASFSGCFFYL